MFRHYLSMTLRSFARHKLYSFINIIGAVGNIALDPLYFLAAGGGALLIAWATVHGNTLLLARTSPVRALRYE